MHPNPIANSLPHLDYKWVFIASLLVSAWLIAWDPMINRDAIIYLRSADAYLQHGFAASQHLFGRPLLSICMAFIHQLTGIPLLYAGLAIVTLSYALLCTGFVATVHTLGGDRRVQLIAAIVVMSHPLLNHTRSSIMRDPAYWALLLLSFRELLLYVRQPGLKHQLRWFTYVIAACLFRFEGLFFATLAPLALLFTRDMPQRLRHCLQLLLPQLLVITAILAGILVYMQQQEAGAKLFPAIAHYIERLQAFPGEFAALAVDSAEPMLQFTARDDAPIAVLAALAAILLLNICRAITWPWLFVLLWGRRAGLMTRFRSDDNVLLRAHILITLSYLTLFLLLNRFMLERYSNQLVLFLLLYLPFILSALWHAGRWKKAIAVVLLLGMTADTLHTGDWDKKFVRDATYWVRDNTPENTSLVSNERYIAYFSEREFDWVAVTAKRFDLNRIMATRRLWRDTNYMVVYLKPRQYESWYAFLEANSLQELRTFENGRKGKVSVVQVRPPHPQRRP